MGHASADVSDQTRDRPKGRGGGGGGGGEVPFSFFCFFFLFSYCLFFFLVPFCGVSLFVCFVPPPPPLVSFFMTAQNLIPQASDARFPGLLDDRPQGLSPKRNYRTSDLLTRQ